jgi:hypothetical protein
MKNKRWIWIIPIILTIITVLIYSVIYLVTDQIPKTDTIKIFSKENVWWNWPICLSLPFTYYWIFDAIPVFIFSFLLTRKITNIEKTEKNIIHVLKKEINVDYQDLIFITLTFFSLGIIINIITFIYLGLLIKIITAIILGILAGFFLYDNNGYGFEPNFISIAGLFFGLGIGLLPLSNFGFPLLSGIFFYYIFLIGFLIKTVVIKNSK